MVLYGYTNEGLGGVGGEGGCECVSFDAIPLVGDDGTVAALEVHNGGILRNKLFWVNPFPANVDGKLT